MCDSGNELGGEPPLIVRTETETELDRESEKWPYDLYKLWEIWILIDMRNVRNTCDSRAELGREPTLIVRSETELGRESQKVATYIIKTKYMNWWGLSLSWLCVRKTCNDGSGRIPNISWDVFCINTCIWIFSFGLYVYWMQEFVKRKDMTWA